LYCTAENAPTVKNAPIAETA